MKYLFSIVCIVCCGTIGAHAQKSLSLVKNGRANACIVIAADAPKYIVEAAADLQWHIRKSSGAELPLLRDNAKAPAGMVPLFVGPSAQVPFDALTKGLAFEEYRLKADIDAGALYFVANDKPENPATHFAISDFLERTIGAKWLWPGELGTVVQQKKDISIAELDVRWISPYDYRFIHKVVGKEVQLWFNHHRIANRRGFQNESNNEGWHQKYYAKYPEIFARHPQGKPYTGVWEERMPKFRMDHPKYLELEVSQYREKGSPALYTLFPTDGGKFDAFMVPGADPLKVYRGELPLTKYYLDFYRKFDETVNGGKTKPARFDILAYSAYFSFPDSYRFNGKNFNVWFVDRDADSANWKKWQGTGAKMYIRPNWWHRGALGPFLSLRYSGDMFYYCKTNGMSGFMMDGYKGNWATQGLNYYLVARLAYAPVTVQQAVDEYCAAFGPAAPAVKEYINACNKNTERFTYDAMDEMREEAGMRLGSYATPQMLPVMFPEPFLLQLDRILAKGVPSATGTDLARLEWLRAGITATGLITKYIRNAMQGSGPYPSPEPVIKELEKIEQRYRWSVSPRTIQSVLNKKMKAELMKPAGKK